MESDMTPQQAFSEALHRAGSQAALAAIVGKQQPAISRRLNGSRRAEPDEVISIERHLGVSRHLLRPDLYPAEPSPTSLAVATPAPIVAYDRGGISYRKASA